MKLSCEKNVLQSIVNTASRATQAKSALPGVEGLLLEAGAKLRVTGYDLKKCIYADIEADIAEPGSIVLNARLFSEMIRRLPEGTVTITADERNNTHVKCGKAEFDFMGLSADDFPEVPSVETQSCYSLPQSVLKSMINETIFAVSDNESRPVYTGSRFEIEDGMLTLVSVDGFRLAIRREKLECDTLEDRFVVPGTALSDVERICAGDCDDMVKIAVSSNHVSFTVGDTVIISRRLEGDFLNYRKALPTEFKSKVTVARSDMLRAIDRVSLIIDEKSKNPVRLCFTDGKVICTCNTPIGKAEDTFLCEGDADGLEIGFNGKYLMDALKAAPTDELILCLNTNSAPCVMLPADNCDSFRYMILPIRLRG